MQMTERFRQNNRDARDDGQRSFSGLTGTTRNLCIIKPWPKNRGFFMPVIC